MSRNLFNLLLFLAFVTVAAVLTLFKLDSVIVKCIFALPLVLILPGYTLTKAIFPDHALDFTIRLALSIGVSLAVTIIGGLVLNATPWGLSQTTWLLWLGGITVYASLVAWLKNRGESTAPLTFKFSIGIHLRQALFFGLVIGLVIVAMFIARDSALQQSTTNFTQLWMLPVENGDPNVVHVGITNLESSSVEYHLQVEIQDSLVADWPSIILEPGKKWETSVHLPSQLSEEEIIQALLFRSNSPSDVYRQVHIWRNQ